MGASEATTHDAPRWHVHLLGDLRVLPLVHTPGDTAETEALSRFRTHKAALLLARLLLYPHRSHSREELADWLWPDAPADRGRAHLSQTLSHLRRQFPDSQADDATVAPLFITNHQTVRLRTQTFTTDVADFERRLREARASGVPNAPAEERAARWESVLCAYGGDLLPAFSTTGSRGSGVASRKCDRKCRSTGSRHEPNAMHTPLLPLWFLCPPQKRLPCHNPSGFL